ncbi:MAG: hypothetical protein J6C95_07420 [Muribaculaceae bacterium]|nr:hypothetical protein [Muribaculaceae bacterium]
MIRLIYFLLAALLAVGCVQQAKNTHPQNDVAPIDMSLASTNDSDEHTMLTEPVSTDSVQTDSTQTNSISANLQCPDIYDDREIVKVSFNKDTTETILSYGTIKTFLTESDEGYVMYKNIGDTIWSRPTIANAIISNHDRADTIIITRSLLEKQFNITDIEKYNIASIHYEYEKGDTTCFSIVLTFPDTDIGFDFMYYHTNESYYIEEVYVEWETDED